ncbi:MAG: ABC transporter substrate-binding protein [Thaumarchaeota archaeon]|nr:ABC transporter substrate-binding protein [Nitrososphaerota archaeon]
MKASVFTLLFLFGISTIFSVTVTSVRVNAQSSNSCPANDTLTIAMNGGVPNSFNGINTFTTTGGFTERMSYLSLFPPPSFSGTPDYTESVVNSYAASANYTQWTFNVRPGLQWSDGTNVSSQDIANTFSSAFALNASADVQGLRLEITKVNVINSSAATFVLNKTDAHLPERLSGILYSNIMPKSFIPHGSFFNGFDGTYPGDGPYVIVNYTEGSPQAVLVPNPYYKPAPGTCMIILDYVESQSQVSTLLQAGTADMGAYVPYADISNVLAHSPALKLVDQKNVLVTDLSYNNTIYPYNMTAFRQALAYAINESQVDQTAFSGYANTAYNSQGGIPSSETAWYSSNQTTYSYNQAQALQLLSSIGIKQNSNKQLTYPNGTVVTLSLWTESDYDADITAQTVIQQNLDALGFNIVQAPATLQSNIIGDTYANVNGIDSAMVIDSDEACDFGMPLLDALPVWQVCLPLAAPPTWEMPPSAQAAYESNLTALQATANMTQEFHYLANIQALNAKYLPVIIVNYADAPIIVSNARFTNWPSSNLLDGFGIELNNTAIVNLQPVSGATSTSASSPTTSSSASAATTPTTTSSPVTSVSLSTATSLATTTAVSTVVSTAVTTVTNSAGGGLSTTAIAAIVIVVVIIIAAVAALAMRRRPAPKTT